MPSTEPVATVVADSGQSGSRHRLREAEAFVFDMDGVLYRGGHLLPGVSDVLNALEIRERRYIFATNNSMASPDEYVAKLANMGISVRPETILTSGTATRDYLLNHLPPDAGIFVIGMPALREQIFAGTVFRPVQYAEEQPAAVVVGLDLGFTYDKMKTANAAIRAGAEFIATNADATLPTEAGLVPGAGSIIAGIATASGRQPVVVGKPEPLILEQAMERLAVSPSRAVMIGDRLDTDVVAGQRAGMLTALVLTGVSTRDEVPASPVLPDLIFTDLPSMLDAIVGND